MAYSHEAQHALAVMLANQMIDEDLKKGGIGEAKKAFEFFRAFRNRSQLLAMLRLRSDNKQPFAQNQNTPAHNEKVLNLLEGILTDYHDLTDKELITIFGWAVRLAIFRKETQSPLPQKMSVPLPTPSGPVHNAGSSLLQPNETFRGTIVELLDSGVKIKHPDHPIESVLGVIDSDQMGKQQFKVKNTRWVKIRAVRTTAKGLTILELEPTANPNSK
nr:hypothetical protein [Oscillochloris trichoides]